MTEGYGINSKGSWVTWDGKNILWLLLDYCLVGKRAISRHCIVLGTATTQVCIINFSGPPPFDFLF